MFSYSDPAIAVPSNPTTYLKKGELVFTAITPIAPNPNCTLQFLQV
jgi:hypothetical protein